jgi:hypothetical protein
MSELLTIPAPTIILQRIRDCREELQALKKLLRAAEAATKADEARTRRGAKPFQVEGGRNG